MKDNFQYHRTRLSITQALRQDIIERLPPYYRIGRAFDQGDCFFDAVAQRLNQRLKSHKYEARSLRKLCADYIQNKHCPPVFIRKAAEYRMTPYILCEYLAFTATDLKKVKRTAVNLDLETAIWGDPDIEGRIICYELNIRIHLIEIQAAIDTENPLPIILEQLISKSGVKSLEHPLDKAAYDQADLIHLVVSGNHFVPLLVKPKSKRLSPITFKKLREVRFFLEELQYIEPDPHQWHQQLRVSTDGQTFLLEDLQLAKPQQLKALRFFVNSTPETPSLRFFQLKHPSLKKDTAFDWLKTPCNYNLAKLLVQLQPRILDTDSKSTPSLLNITDIALQLSLFSPTGESYEWLTVYESVKQSTDFELMTLDAQERRCRVKIDQWCLNEALNNLTALHYNREYTASAGQPFDQLREDLLQKQSQLAAYDDVFKQFSRHYSPKTTDFFCKSLSLIQSLTFSAIPGLLVWLLSYDHRTLIDESMPIQAIPDSLFRTLLVSTTLTGAAGFIAICTRLKAALQKNSIVYQVRQVLNPHEISVPFYGHKWKIQAILNSLETPLTPISKTHSTDEVYADTISPGL